MKRFGFLCLVLCVFIFSGVASAIPIKDVHEDFFNGDKHVFQRMNDYHNQHNPWMWNKFDHWMNDYHDRFQLCFIRYFNDHNWGHHNEHDRWNHHNDHGGWGHHNDPPSTAPVPEPATILLMGSAGIVGLISKMRGKISQ